MTYADIEAEIAKFEASFGRPLPPHARHTFAAWMQHTAGMVVTEHCPDCGGLLAVTEYGGTAWTVSCPCGRCRDTMRGL